MKLFIYKLDDCNNFLAVYSKGVSTNRPKLVKADNMSSSNRLHSLVTGFIFTVGIIDFISGDFIFSTMLFALASFGFIGK